MVRLLLISFFFCCVQALGQKDTLRGPAKTDFHGTLINDVRPDTWQSLDTVKAPAVYDNIYSRKLYGDSLVTSFVIFVKKEVREHKHEFHAEHVMVLEGEATMQIDTRSFTIRTGDLVFIPRNSWHQVKVTSKTPLKVVSLQAPAFDGKDRIFKETK